MAAAPPPATPGAARRAIDALLADGRPHGRDELLEAATTAVHPGRAWRKAEQARKADQRRHGGTETPRQRGDERQAIDAGARRIARDALRKAVEVGAVVRLADGTYQIADPCPHGA